VLEAITTGPYGRCVYACDNDVVDHQVVNLQFEGGATAALTTVAFSEKICQRSTRVFGTAGELEGDGERELRIVDFRTGAVRHITADGPPAGSRMSGHGGADYFLAASFVAAVASGDASHIVSGPDETLESHLLVFAAEEARHKGTVLHLSGRPDAVPLDARDLSW